jgi:hypothetical protein
MFNNIIDIHQILAILRMLVAGFPLRPTWIQFQARLCGICGGQSDTGACLSKYFGFLHQFSFHQLFHINYTSIIDAI